MAKAKKADKAQSYGKPGTASKAAKESKKNDEEMRVCGMPPVPERPLPDVFDPNRAFLIRRHEKKWVNGTILHYFFLDQPARWRGADKQKQAVRDAFAKWKDLGIGVEFVEVNRAEEAEIRIGFDFSDGSWSYVGRDAIDHVPDPTRRTMNFGWDLTTSYGRDTALHEIGHALGFPHEHQNPNAGIVWDEQAVIEYFSGSPNYWNVATIRHNILNKIDAVLVEGSDWDRDSIMHYSFKKGLIRKPEKYQTQDLRPAPGLSEIDVEEVRRFYPSLPSSLPELKPWQSHQVKVNPGEQLDFAIVPETSRDHTIQTFGRMDTVLVLFEEIDGVPRYYDGDDDSGWRRNALIRARLFSGRRYILRMRLSYADAAGEGAIFMY